MIVVLHHVVQYFECTQSMGILHRLFPGSASVLVFFVLSGLVLAMTFVYRDGDRYIPFIIKRFFRIWPLFALVVCASAGMLLAIGHHYVSGAASTFHANWGTPVSASMLGQHLAMSGTHTDLDGPMWSLIHEMRISILFPFLIAMVLWNWRIALIATSAVSVLSGAIHPSPGFVSSLLSSTRFLALFVFGALIALHLAPLRRKIGSAPKPVRIILWLLCLAGAAAAADYSGAGATVSSNLRLLAHGVAAAGLVLLSISGTTSALLLAYRIPVYLGRISYSLYLIHAVGITACVQALREVLPLPVSVGIGVVLSIIAADMLQRWVEQPLTQVGRKLARSLSLEGQKASRLSQI